MPDERYRVFLSATTSEFVAARDAVAQDLRSRGLTVKVQSDFRLEDEAPTTLDKLHKYIRECHAVVAIIGKRSGSFPPPAAAAPYAEMLPAGVSAASFTQWEVWFALHYHKPLWLFIANDNFQPDEPHAPNGDDPDSPGRLVDYLQNTLGLDYSLFATVEQLRIAVLRKDWPNFATHRPKKLPYDSLGELFMGREPFLNDLKSRVADARKRKQWPKHAVCGLGGVGKTRLAVEYAWRHAEEYSAVLLVNAESAESLERDLKSLAGVFHANLDPATPDPDRMRLTCEWLERNPGWLLVVDNVDTEEALEAVTKRFAEWSQGHVLITGRVTHWPRGVESLELEVLAPGDARDFLLRATDGKRRETDDDENTAAALAKEELDCLCLALEQSAAYIAERRLTFAEYRKRWQDNSKDVRAWANKTLMHYHEESAVSLSIATTWQTTFDALSPPARTLLEMLSFLAPDPLPRGLLEHPEMENQLRVASGDETADVETALAELRRYSLLLLPKHLPDDAVGQVHRLVQLITRDRMAEEVQRGVLQSSATAAAAYADVDPQDVRDWPILQPLVGHLRALTGFLIAVKIAAPTAGLLDIVGRLAQFRGSYREAEHPLRQALDIDERYYGPDHPHVAIRLNNLAQLLKVTNRLEEAEPLMRRALDIGERNYGPDHPRVAIRLNNFAGLLRATNRLAEAEPLMRRALDINERSYGQNHPRVAIQLNNLAQLLQDRNRLAEAESLVRRALDIDERSYGPDHPNVAIRLNNLVTLMFATNRLTEAEPLMRRALAIDERSYGRDHPRVAIDLNNLAQLLQATNRLAAAEPLMRRALDIDERSFGHDHPDVATDLNNLAQLLQSTNRVAEAEPLMRRALEIYERSFGRDHPDVATSLSNLAQLLQATNRLSEAEPLMRRALEIDEQSYGKEHPNVALRLNNLAQLLKATNRLAAAEPLMRRALVIFQNSLGYDHPNSKIVADNLQGLLDAIRNSRPK